MKVITMKNFKHVLKDNSSKITIISVAYGKAMTDERIYFIPVQDYLKVLNSFLNKDRQLSDVIKVIEYHDKHCYMNWITGNTTKLTWTKEEDITLLNNNIITKKMIDKNIKNKCDTRYTYLLSRFAIYALVSKLRNISEELREDIKKEFDKIFNEEHIKDNISFQVQQLVKNFTCEGNVKYADKIRARWNLIYSIYAVQTKQNPFIDQYIYKAAENKKDKNQKKISYNKLKTVLYHGDIDILYSIAKDALLPTGEIYKQICNAKEII